MASKREDYTRLVANYIFSVEKPDKYLNNAIPVWKTTWDIVI